MTGLPGSGKSVIARELAQKLKEKGVKAQILSSDELRKVVTPQPKYTEEERDFFYNVLAFFAKLLALNGVNVIIDATGNRRRYRDRCRADINRFMEVYVKCPLEICVQRERERTETLHAPRRIYERGFKGESATVPGVGVPYEEPLNPEVTVESDKLSPEGCAQRIVEALKNKSFIAAG